MSASYLSPAWREQWVSPLKVPLGCDPALRSGRSSSSQIYSPIFQRSQRYADDTIYRCKRQLSELRTRIHSLRGLNSELSESEVLQAYGLGASAGGHYASTRGRAVAGLSTDIDTLNESIRRMHRNLDRIKAISRSLDESFPRGDSSSSAHAFAPPCAYLESPPAYAPSPASSSAYAFSPVDAGRAEAVRYPPHSSPDGSEGDDYNSLQADRFPTSPDMGVAASGSSADSSPASLLSIGRDGEEKEERVSSDRFPEVSRGRERVNRDLSAPLSSANTTHDSPKRSEAAASEEASECAEWEVLKTWPSSDAPFPRREWTALDASYAKGRQAFNRSQSEAGVFQQSSHLSSHPDVFDDNDPISEDGL